MKRFVFLALGLACGSIAVAADTLTLSDALAAVRARHPALAAARAQAEAARAKIDQEKAWADPRASLEIKREDNLRPTTYSEVELSVSQELPLSRRNELRARSAAAEASVADAGIRVKERALLSEARAAYLRIAASDTEITILQRRRELLKQSVALAQQAYEVGQQTQVDLITAQSELTQLDTEETNLASERAENAARLNALMARPADTPIPELTLPAVSPITMSGAEAMQLVRAHHPELLMAARRIAAAEAQVAVARKNRTPDPEVMARARQMNGSGKALTGFDTGVSVSLPWFNDRRNRAQVAEAQSGVAAARAEAETSEVELSGMVASMRQRATLAYQQYERYRDQLLPLARARAEAEQRGYEAGGTPLFAVLAAQNAALEAEHALHQAHAQCALATAEFEFLTNDVSGF